MMFYSEAAWSFTFCCFFTPNWSHILPKGLQEARKLTVVVFILPPGCVQVQPDLLISKSQPSPSKHGSISHHCFVLIMRAVQKRGKKRQKSACISCIFFSPVYILMMIQSLHLHVWFFTLPLLHYDSSREKEETP